MEDMTLKRSMFMMPLKSGTMNSGIMQGFEEEEDDDDEVMSSAELTRRTPQSPEILMNNLRGDMRSVDARYEELAQMVGDEAAMETPPEVLALLQGQMAAGAGIGQLPQGQGMVPPPMMPPEQSMMPPGAGMMPPEQGMMGQGPGPTDQGGIADMMPVQGFANGGEVAALLRARPGATATASPASPSFLRGLGLAYEAGADKLGRFGPSFLKGAGLIGGAVTANELIVDPIRKSLMENFGPLPIGAGAPQGPSRLPANLRPPGIGRSLEDATVRREAERLAGETPLVMTPTPLLPEGGVPQARPLFSQADMLRLGLQAEQDAAAPPRLTADAAPEMPGGSLDLGRAPDIPVTEEGPAEGETTEEFLSRAGRVRERFGEYAPLFQELLQGDKDSQQTQAMFLLADAGMRLARGSGRLGTSFATELATATADLPSGMARLAAQKSERDTAIKTAALQQAVSDIESEDAAVRAIRLQELKNANALMMRLADAGQINKTEDLGGGATRYTRKNGQQQIVVDPDYVDAFVSNPFTISPVTSPYVSEVKGTKPRVVTDPTLRREMERNLNEIDGVLQSLTLAQEDFENAFGIGSATVNMYNNLLVPFGATPNVQNAEAIQRLTQLQTQLRPILTRVLGSQTGRLAVQEQEWVNSMIGDKPGAFLSDPTLAMKNTQLLVTSLKNARMRLAGNLGLVDKVVIEKAPGLGVPNDPLLLPDDPQKRDVFGLMISQQFADKPDTLVSIKWPNGTVRQIPARELVNIGGTR